MFKLPISHLGGDTEQAADDESGAQRRGQTRLELHILGLSMA